MGIGSRPEKTWQAELIELGNATRIAVYFPYSVEAKLRFKKLVGAAWSNTFKVWHLPDNDTYRIQFGLPLKMIGKNVWAHIHEENKHAMLKMQEEMDLRGLSVNTCRTYLNELAQLLYIIKDFPVENLTVERLRVYFVYCKNELKMSENSIHGRINAVKFYFEKVLGRDKFFVEIPRPKKHFILPKVVSEERVLLVLLETPNLKHRTILMTAYSCGLRVSEVVSIKIQDIDFDRKQLFVEKAKGKKDRYVPLGNFLVDLLSLYMNKFKPNVYLFEGQFSGSCYSTRSAQAIMKHALRRCNLPEHYSFHALRHSYATHLLEGGTDIRLIKELLGHNNLKTTERYTHVSQKSLDKIENPLDKIIRNLKDKDKDK